MIYKEADLSAWPPPKKLPRLLLLLRLVLLLRLRNQNQIFFTPANNKNGRNRLKIKNEIKTSCYLSRVENLHYEKKKANCTLYSASKIQERWIVTRLLKKKKKITKFDWLWIKTEWAQWCPREHPINTCHYPLVFTIHPISPLST